MNSHLQDAINNKLDIKNGIASLVPVSGKSKSTGNEYTCLVLTFRNGYEQRIFLNSEGKTLLDYLLRDMSQTEVSFDSDSDFEEIDGEAH